MKRRPQLSKESGVALFICLFALMLLAAIGLGLMYLASTETTINYNYRSSLQAFYAAKGGAMEAVDRLRQGDGTANYSITPPTTMPSSSSTTGVVYIVNGSDVKPWDSSNSYFDNELCNERFLNGAGGSAVCPTGSSYFTQYSSQMPYASTTPFKWARITLKQSGTFAPYRVDSNTNNDYLQVCWTGSNEVIKPSTYTDCATPPANGNPYSPVYIVTALASAQSGIAGGARRMYQMEYAPAPPLNVVSAVASFAGVNLTGKLTVNGYDQCSCKQVGSNYGVARYAGGTCKNNTSAIYSAGDVDNPNSSETVVAGTGPIIENVGSSWPSSLNVDTLISQFQPSSVNVATCSSGGNCTLKSGSNVLGPIPTLPSSDPANMSVNGQISYIGGNITMNGGGGSGILLVNGDLTIHGGGFQWYGLLLVHGTVTFQGGGSADTNIEGAVISGEDANANIDTTLGGSVNIMLDRCAISNSMQGQPLVYLGGRELLF